ncbi:hypothetical protein [Flavobacterium daemonense]|uniref:hypothetical protein n=1 Tax=Flavobacterium daemonense TaxID=1393049 RepID=UPI001185E56C|nr:hypothetical protein [Flavobacterium daemonense]KAF2336152.1 hypothetical protein FND99_02395 [Flavobacterium daemonense]
MKQSPNFNTQVYNTINNNETTLEELKAIEPILIENCKSSIKQMYTFYFTTVVLIFIWFLVDCSIIKEINFLDVNLKNKKVLLVGISFLSVICYYFTITYMAFNQLIDAGLKQIQYKIYPNLSKSSILELTIYPSLIELESIKARLSNDSFLSTAGFIFVSILFMFLPLIANGVICYKLFFSNSISCWFPILYLFILIKIFCNIIFYFHQVQ